jgi:hypothetical protein
VVSPAKHMVGREIEYLCGSCLGCQTPGKGYGRSRIGSGSGNMFNEELMRKVAIVGEGWNLKL